MQHSTPDADGERPRSFELVGLTLASAIAVAASSECYDLMDTAIGLTLLTLLRQCGFRSAPDRGNRLLWSAVVGLCVVLVVGMVIDSNLLPNTACTERPHIAFLVWLASAAAANLYRLIEHRQ